MKKTLLLFLLLPFFGFAQTDLVQWTGSTDLKPTVLNDYILASDVTGAGLTTGPTASYDGIIGTGWPTANTINTGKYFQIVINPILDGTFTLNQILFTYKGDSKSYQVQYSKQANFSSPTTLVTVNGTAVSTNTPTSGNLTGLNIAVNAGEKLYIRFFAYNGGNWKLMDTNLLKLRGTITKVPSPMIGNYVIGSVATASFPTITNAVKAINTVGSSGAVNFLLDNTAYNTSTSETFPIVINSYTGNTTNKLTIRPNTGRTVTITGTTSSNNAEAVFKLNGVDNVVFDGSNNSTTTNNLTIFNNNQSNNNRAVIWIASQNSSNGALSNEIKNLTLQQYAKGSYDYSVGVFAGGTSSVSSEAEAANSTTLVKNVTFTGAGQAIYLNGNSTLLSSDWKIQDNIIGGTTNANKPYVGVNFRNAKDYEISGNLISGLIKTDSQTTTANHAGISILGNSKGAIFRNTIKDVYDTTQNTYCAGIYLDSGDNLVYNNFISNIRTTADNSDSNFQAKGHGIFLNSGASNKIYYNTIVMNAGTSAGRGACLFVSNGSSLEVRNNIFHNIQTTGNQYTIFTRVGSSAFSVLSNNNHYVSNIASFFSARLIDATYNTSVSDWQTATTKEAGSTSVEPKFISTTDYHLVQNTTNSGIHAKGTPIAGITTDIDSETRSTSVPDMGADEIIICEQGDQTTFGVNSWIGYVYKWTGAIPNPAVTDAPASATNVFIGNVTEAAQFDRNVGAGAVSGATTNICGTPPVDKFFVRYKMKTTTAAGIYNITIGGDDGTRLYIDGTLVVGNWTTHGYTANSVQYTLTAGSHDFILEYFENDGDARTTISYGLIKGDPKLPYGDNVWNVYGFTESNLNIPDMTNVNGGANSYAGVYVDPNFNVNSQTYWNKTKSPSFASIWQGAPIQIDYFTTSHRRQGFPCGAYQIQLVNCDDVAQIYIDGILIFTQNGYTTATSIINSGQAYLLNKNSKVEIRLREDGGDANVAFNFISVPNVYDGTGPAPTSTTAITISSNTTLQSDIQVCSCTINPGVTLTVPTDKTLTVEENITVGTGGKLLIENGGALMQTNTSSSAYTGSTSSFEMQRTTKVRRYDLTQWSSPVTTASGFTLHSLSPETLADKYYSYNAASSAWTANYGGTLVMTTGQGYSVRAPQSFDITTPYVFQASFIGIPNNGNIPIATESGKWNLIGNPYPSAVKGKDLIDANKQLGSLYFWTHNTAPTGTKGTYSSSDYAVYNLSGGTTATSGGSKPLGYIAAGQAFFVKVSNAVPVLFTNDVRIGANNTQFYKTEKTETVGENRLWLNFSNGEGAFKQILLGYFDGATNSFDTNYDASTISGNSYVDFYTINDSKKLTIQGRAMPFDNSESIPVGYKSTVAGEFTISIDSAEGIFNDQAVYLEDKTTGKIQDLRTGNYTFNTEIGTFTNRFVLNYVNKTLGNDDFENVESGLLVSVKNKIINVTSSTENIKDITIYDISGKIIYTKKKIGTTELEISNLQSSNQVLLVKVSLENDFSTTKKIIFK
ncbi:T9SS sorting signal type C domain-containing protein [Flavobacterium reichenbachii]|uniref:T9SS sorting signal type C domain-containing protein n=1 Tax=Flavobacterium reichenbachii TaxID=362418 RepID=UPI000691A976|nr:T9SS sorting signal type C domain-containing protein [Flavobacterium reichenbachii]OXB14250.1 hypothetical protein B0A68_13590 [Flavobacterium reichenbachii]